MSRPFRALALSGLIAAALPVACTAQPPADTAGEARNSTIAPPPAATPARPLVTGLPDFTTLVQRVGPAVVNVSAEIAPRRAARGQMPGQGEIPEFFRRMLPPGMLPDGPQMPQAPGGVSLGTGFLISDDGYLLTNHHVVDGADKITVRLSDRRELEAEVIGSDEQYDVALLKIDATGLPFLRAADASLTRPGQWAVAIGSPFGLDHSVTAGIVSAVGRSNPYSGQQYVPFIQSDVAINRGNSGGPLLNTSGEVIGINSQIFSNSGGYMGVSFAIPIDLAMNAAEQLKETGSVRRGLLGVQVQAIDAETARGFGLKTTTGALVSVVSPGSAAEKAGMEVGDVIRSVDGRPVNTSADLPPLIGARAPGSEVRLGVVRDGKLREFKVVLGALEGEVASAPARPDEEGDAPRSSSGNPLGLTTQSPTAAQRRQLGLEAGEGVLITAVGDGAARADLRPGDVVMAVGRKPVGSPAALDRELADAGPGDTVMLLVRRGGGTQFVAVTLD
ncbi:DegQ family serine endoprotease [Marilutibacter chinensis]|uniref:Probable periplasmic serine endoprotease DegP-like n=1 Tax=Marilutibacter chinensis TaxID=2912247 RepID=A0ABS9HY63_9GAMM|nr:DegQ family serine endoprotease [Lysobacter chinensis]MCF7223496.1 DegQ family serine endoprotease [Lysobacter chinensis]